MFSTSTFLKNLADAMGGVMLVVESVAYLLAIVALIMSLVLAVKAADGHHGRHEKKLGWLWSFLAAVSLFALPSLLNTGGQFFFGTGVQTSGSLTYSMDSVNKPLAPLVPVLKVFGVIAVLRAIWLARALGVDGRTHNNTPGRVVILGSAGIMLVHMQYLLSIVSGLTGIDVGSRLF